MTGCGLHIYVYICLDVVYIYIYILTGCGLQGVQSCFCSVLTGQSNIAGGFQIKHFCSCLQVFVCCFHH